MADRVGQHVGNYRLIRLLGRGGFAEVYLGEHLRLGTQAAVKVLHTLLASHDDVEGFEKEARTVAHLKHPHIVRVLDYDVEEDVPFLVMDYAMGGTLRHRHPKGTCLPLTAIISYVKQIADALQYAHEQRVIHRDVKPENMLLGEHHTLLLSDFGIAIAAQSSRYQNTQNMGGTMAYIAPEQIQGHPRPASDQYSLGIVVYEWLSGNCPFHGSMTEIVAQHLAASPPSLHEQAPTISSEVEQVVLMALEKDPRKRFSSVKAFAMALEQASQNTQVSVELPSVLLPSSVSVTVLGEQTLQTERSLTERIPSPEQPALQTPLQSPVSASLPPETPSGSPAVRSTPSLPPTIPAQSFLRPNELQTRWHAELEAPENLGKESFPTFASGSSRIEGLVVPPREKLIRAIGIVVASILLAAVLGNWIVSQRLASTPTLTNTPTLMPTPTATPVPAGIITEFPLPAADSHPDGITAGPDGNIWFTGDGIGRISSSGTITEFPTAGGKGIAAGPDGNLWFTEFSGNKIGRISPSGSITEFPLPMAQSTPDGITAGPDGNLWFTEDQWDAYGNITGSEIGRISPSGAITEFPIPTANGGPSAITVGPDGNLWFTEAYGDKIGRISPSGTITEFPVPTAHSDTDGITAGPDGNLWFTDPGGDKIGRISPSGTITEFPLPTVGSDPQEITAGPDGNLWFTEYDGNKIGRISPSGTITEFPIPTAISDPSAITTGPDGNLWFTENQQDAGSNFIGSKIGRITSGRRV